MTEPVLTEDRLWETLNVDPPHLREALPSAHSVPKA